MTQPPVHDAAIVLGAAIGPDGAPSIALRRRVGHAVSLYRQGHVGLLLMSGGVGRYPPAEAELMRGLALAAEVPAEAILIEARSRTTLENAAFCKPIMRERGWRKVLVVTDAYHLPRALYTFRRLGLTVEGAAAPAPSGGRLLIAQAREIAAFATYLWRVERHLWRDQSPEA